MYGDPAKRPLAARLGCTSTSIWIQTELRAARRRSDETRNSNRGTAVELSTTTRNSSWAGRIEARNSLVIAPMSRKNVRRRKAACVQKDDEFVPACDSVDDLETFNEEVTVCV